MADTLQTPDLEAGRLGADQQQAGLRQPFPDSGERAQELRNALALVQVAEAAEERRAVDPCGRDVRRRPGRMRDALQRPVVAVLAHLRLDIARMHDDGGRTIDRRVVLALFGDAAVVARHDDERALFSGRSNEDRL